MITVRPSHERGHANFGWLDSRHTFSFGSYYDPNYLGFGHLRVINEDKVQPSRGFDTHRHRDMEIITYVLQGELEHKDSIGNGSVIRSGDVQRMSAGKGIAHSEFNASSDNPVHFLQMWLIPKQTGLEPSYEQKHFSLDEKQENLKLVASPDGRDNSVTVHQDAFLYVSVLHEGDVINHEINPHRSIWLQMVKGSVEIQGKILLGGDGAAIIQDNQLSVTATSDETEFLLFDLA